MGLKPAIAGQIARGAVVAAENCGACHAVGAEDASPLAGAPAFRDLSQYYPVEYLAEALAVDALRARFESLTPREGEVLRCVIGGALNKQIAAQLGIAEKTVKIHRGRVMEKLAVGSVAELVRLCQQAGVWPLKDP